MDLGIRSPVEPPSSLADHGNGESPELPRMNGKYHGHVNRRQQNQVYVHRRSLGLTSGETNGGTISDVE